jgi:large subunit ribosomal protein L9
MWRIEEGRAMKVILRDNIENLGKRGDIVNVATGYGRNYLIPKKLALEVTPSNMKMVEQQQKALRKKLEKEVQTYREQIEKINAIRLTFLRKAGDKDSIFGSVSVSDVSKALEEKGFEVEKKKILLAEPIKKLGTYKIPIKVFHEDRAEITLEVIKEGAVDEKPKGEEKPGPIPESAVQKPGEEGPEKSEATEEGEAEPAQETQIESRPETGPETETPAAEEEKTSPEPEEKSPDTEKAGPEEAEDSGEVPAAEEPVPAKPDPGE